MRFKKFYPKVRRWGCFFHTHKLIATRLPLHCGGRNCVEGRGPLATWSSLDPFLQLCMETVGLQPPSENGVCVMRCYLHCFKYLVRVNGFGFLDP